MIKRWKLKNFKSFRELPPLELSQINVIAGANSSGKSSIIQSILLLKQTLQYGSENRPVAFNGPLLRLGGFDDVRHFDAVEDELEIGLELEFDEPELLSPTMTPWARGLRRSWSSAEGGILRGISLTLSYGGDASVGAHPGVSALTPYLTKSTLRVSRSSHDVTKDAFASYTRDRKETVYEDGTVLIAKYAVNIDEDSKREITLGKPKAYLGGGYASYFLPSWIAVRYDAAAKRTVNLVEGIFDSSTAFFGGSALTDEKLSSGALEIVNKWLAEHEAEPLTPDTDDGLISAGAVRETLIPYMHAARPPDPLRRWIKPRPNEKVAADLAQLRESVLAELLARCDAEYDVELETPRAISAGSEFVKEFLKQGVRYLGPLRDSPRPVYQPEALESTTDVGYRGQHTAAVLDLNRLRRVNYHRPPSESADDDYVSFSEPRTATLHDAVVDWLIYLGIADDVVTTDAGVFGNRLQVSTDGLQRLHDLTNVGVGVSQVLPIVVMALLAPRGSFLIFEQPELHLHPKVQARLADFFLALAKDGKQSLLETHSEYLVDRFRLRVALSETDAVRPLINILFSEKQGSDSILRPIEISEFGAVINWPKDFFEQSQRDVARIIKAASLKRSARKRTTGRE